MLCTHAVEFCHHVASSTSGKIFVVGHSMGGKYCPFGYSPRWDVTQHSCTYPNTCRGRCCVDRRPAHRADGIQLWGMCAGRASALRARCEEPPTSQTFSPYPLPLNPEPFEYLNFLTSNPTPVSYPLIPHSSFPTFDPQPSNFNPQT